MRTSDVVVLGGGGFIGRMTVDRLLESGYSVKVVSRQPAALGHAAPGLSFAPGNVSDPEAMKRAIAGARAVVHMTTGGGSSWADFERDFCEGAKNVAAACLEHGVGRLVYASSIAALYLGAKNQVSERDGLDPKPEGRGHYARAKIAAEGILQSLHRSHGLPLVIVRPGVVMGRGGMLSHSGVGLWACDTQCIGWGRGNTPLPFVLVQDVAQALAAAVDTPGIEGMSFNLAGDVYLTAREFVSLLAKRSNRRFRFYPQSLFKLQLIEIAKWTLKVAARKQNNPFPSFRDLKSRALRSELDCSAAKQMLGWKPNGDLDVFLEEAIDSHLTPIPAGDLRLLAQLPVS